MTDPKKIKQPEPPPKRLTPEEVQARFKESQELIADGAKRMEEAGMPIRSNVLFASILIEHHIGSMLLSLMQVRKPELINLNFNQKIEFLEAFDVIGKKEKNELNAFKFVRNKFVHEFPINTFVKCFEKDTGHKKIVLDLADKEVQILPSEFTWDEEKRLSYGFNLLSSQVAAITDKILKETLARRKQIELGYKFEMVFDLINHNIGQPISVIKKSIMVGEKSTFSKEDVGALLDRVDDSITATMKAAVEQAMTAEVEFLS